MKRAQILALAGAIQAIRNDWDHNGIISQLTKLDNNWTGTEPELAAHAMTIAANPAAQTPGAFNAPPPSAARATTPTGAKEERCFICGNLKRQCEMLYDIETKYGVPDPHRFETARDAEANSSRATAQRKLEAIAALAKSKGIPA